MRFLLLTDDEGLASAVRTALQTRGVGVDCSRSLPAPDSLGSIHDALLTTHGMFRNDTTGWLDAWRRQRANAPVLMLDDIGPEALAATLQALADQQHSIVARRWMDGELLIDVARERVLLDGVPVECTPIEWQVLRLLASHPERAVSRSEVARLIGGDDGEASDNAVAVHLYNIRRKLGRHAIETIRGRGFRLRP